MKSLIVAGILMVTAGLVAQVTVTVAEPSVKAQIAVSAVNGGEGAAIASRAQRSVSYKVHDYAQGMTWVGGLLVLVGYTRLFIKRQSPKS